MILYNQDRRSGIYATDAPAIFGINQKKTINDVFLEKISVKSNYFEPHKKLWGSNANRVLIDVFNRQYNKNASYIHKNHVHKSEIYPWMISEGNGWIDEERALVVIKTDDSLSDDATYVLGPNTNKVSDVCDTVKLLEVQDYSPMIDNEQYDFLFGQFKNPYPYNEYLIECAHHSATMDADIVYVYVLEKGEFKLFMYKKDHMLESYIQQMEKEFWHQNVLQKTRPHTCTQSEADEICQFFFGKNYNPTQKLDRAIGLVQDKAERLSGWADKWDREVDQVLQEMNDEDVEQMLEEEYDPFKQPAKDFGEEEVIRKKMSEAEYFKEVHDEIFNPNKDKE